MTPAAKLALLCLPARRVPSVDRRQAAAFRFHQSALRAGTPFTQSGAFRIRPFLRLGSCLTGGAAALLGVPLAQAQSACTPYSLGPVVCHAEGAYADGIQYVVPQTAAPQDLTLVLDDDAVIRTNDDYRSGISISNVSGGSLAITAGSKAGVHTAGTGSIGVAGITTAGDLTVHANSIETLGSEAHGLVAGSVSGSIDVDVGSVVTHGDHADAVHVEGYSGPVAIQARTVSTLGAYSNGIRAHSTEGGLVIAAGSVTTTGDHSLGISASVGKVIEVDPDTGAQKLGPDTPLSIAVGSVRTSGYASDGIDAINQTRGATSVKADEVITTGDRSWGIYAGGFGDVSVETGSIRTNGENALGIGATSIYGNTDVAVGSVETDGTRSIGINVLNYSQDGAISVTAGSVATHGASSTGVYVGGSASYSGALHRTSLNIGSVSTEGRTSAGVAVLTGGDIDADIGSVKTEAGGSRGVVLQTSEGDIDLHAGSIATNGLLVPGRDSIGLWLHADHGAVNADVGSVSTRSDFSGGIVSSGFDTSQTIVVHDGVTTVGYSSSGISAAANGGSVTIRTEDRVTTGGDRSTGVSAQVYSADVALELASIQTRGSQADAVYVTAISEDGREHQLTARLGNISTIGSYSSGASLLALGGTIGVEASSISTIGDSSSAITATSVGGYDANGGATFGGDISIHVDSVVTGGDDAPGIDTLATGTTVISADAVATHGRNSSGIHAYGAGDITIDAGQVETTGDSSFGIYANNNVGGTDSGAITISAGDVRTGGNGSQGIWATAYGGSTSINANSVSTTGKDAHAVYGSSYLGNTTIAVGTVHASGGSDGIRAVSGGMTSVNSESVEATGQGIIAVGTKVDVSAGSVTTSGNDGAGITAHSNYAIDNGMAPRGDISITVGTIATNGYNSDGVDLGNVSKNGNTVLAVDSIDTRGDNSFGIYAASAFGDVTIDAGAITTSGTFSRGVMTNNYYGDTSLSADSIETRGDDSYGVLINSGGAKFSGGIRNSIDVGDVTTTGTNSVGVLSLAVGNDVDTTISVGNVATAGDLSYGIVAIADGRGSDVAVTAGTVTTSGSYSNGITVLNYAAGGDTSVKADNVTVSGQNSAAVFAIADTGDIDIDVDTVNGGGIGGGALYGDLNVRIGKVTTNSDDQIGINVSGENVAVTAGAVDTHGVSASGVIALATKVVSVAADSIATTGEGGFGILAEGRQVTLDIGTIETSGAFATGIYSAVFGRGNASEITIGQGITTSGDYANAVFSISGGTASIHNKGVITTSGDVSAGIVALGLEHVKIDGDGSVSTEGKNAIGIYGLSDAGTTTIGAGKVLTTGDRALGIYAASLDLYGSGEAGSVLVKAGEVRTGGLGSHGIVALNDTVGGEVKIDVGLVHTSGTGAGGIVAISYQGAVSITAHDISTTGGTIRPSYDGGTYVPGLRPKGIYAIGDSVAVDATGSIATTADFATGVDVSAIVGAANVHVNDVTTVGDAAPAVYAFGAGGVNVTISGNVKTSGQWGYGALAFGNGPLVMRNDGSISTAGKFAHGLYATGSATPGATLSVTNTGSITTTGGRTNGIRAISRSESVSIVSSGSILVAGEYSGGIVGAILRAGRGERDGEEDAGPLVAPLLSIDAGSVSLAGTSGGGGIVAFNYRGDVLVNAKEITAHGPDTFGISTLSTLGTSTINVGIINADGRGVLAIADGDSRVTVSGGVTTPNHVALDVTSFHGKAVIDIGKGAKVIAGGAPTRENYAGPGNTILMSGATGMIVNNAGLIANTGTEFTIQAFDVLDDDGALVNVGLTVNNAGRLEGAIKGTAADDGFNNAGVFVVSRNSDFGSGSDTVLNTGTVLVPAGEQGTSRQMTLGGLDSFVNDGGSIDMRNGIIGDSLTLPGDYRGIRGILAVDVGSAGTDRLVIGGLATGHTAIVLNGDARTATLLSKPVALVSVGKGSSADAFDLASSSRGFIDYDLTFDAGEGTFRVATQAGAPVYRLGKISEGASSLWTEASDVWSSHMSAGRDHDAGSSSLWGQTFGKTVRRDNSSSIATPAGEPAISHDLGYSQDVVGGAAGFDLGGSDADGDVSYGVMAGYMSSHLRMRSGAERTKFDVADLGGYFGLRRGPAFLNLLAQYDRIGVRASDRNLAWHDSFSGNAYGVRGDVGARLGSSRLFVEPAATITWQRTDLGRLRALGQSIEFDGMETVSARLGGRIGSTVEFGGTSATVYLRGSYLHQFKGDSRLRFLSGGVTEDVSTSGLGDYGQVAAGLNILSQGRLSGFVEGEGDFGDGARGGGGRVGIRFRL